MKVTGEPIRPSLRGHRLFSVLRLARTRALLACCTASLITGCGSQNREMNVVVFNYWPRALADVYVNKQWVGGGFGSYTEEGGTGGSIYCCQKIATGKVSVKWMLDGPAADPLTGKTMSTTAELDSIKPNADYLAVYLYPDGTVALGTARGIPDDRHRPNIPAHQ